MPEESCRIRLKLPSGAEIETEGGQEFVKAESQRLLDYLQQALTPPPTPPPQREETARSVWKKIAEVQNGDLILRSVPAESQPENACLLLLAAAKSLLSQDKPTATMIAKWLRRSGRPPRRLDRALAGAVRQGDINASGAKRSRRYELTPAGLHRAALLAYQHLQKQEMGD